MNSEPWNFSTEQGRQRWLLIVAGVLVVITAIAYWPRSRVYPIVTSPEGMQLIKRVYSACSGKDAKSLAKTETSIDVASQKGKLSPDETEALKKIVALAKRGDWQTAQDEAFRFAEDQIGYGSPATADAHDHHRH